MERVTLLLVAILLAGCSYVNQGVKPDSMVAFTNESAVLGPEAFPFCDGWVEIWSQVRPGKPTRVIVKATPPAGATWLIQNSNVVVESLDGSGEPIRFDQVHQYEVAGGNALVASWPLFNEPSGVSTGLKIALQPFKGCPSGSSVRGVVLRSSFEQTTIGS